jgi:gliding motility-associated-like protein
MFKLCLKRKKLNLTAKLIKLYFLESKFIQMKSVLLIFSLAFSIVVQGQSLIQNLFFSSDENITKLNFSTAPPNITYTGISDGFEAIAHVEDNGAILFYVNANGVYRGDNTIMPGSTGIIANNSSAEINVCQIPGDPDKYYILYNAETCSPVYYSIVDMSLLGGIGDVIDLNTLIDNGNYGEGLEIVRIPGTNNYWFVTYDCDNGIELFEITAAGIQPGNMVLPFDNNINDVRGELDYHNGKVALAAAYAANQNVAIFDLDEAAGTASNLVTLDISGAYGVEFSPDGTKLYITQWYTIGTNLYQYDFNTGNLTNYSISIPNGLNGWGSNGFGQIEMGTDGRLYIVCDGSNNIFVIENPNDLVFTWSFMQTNYDLSLGVSDHIQSDVIVPLAIEPTVIPSSCFNTNDGQASITIDGGVAPYEVVWSDPDSQTGLTAINLFPGVYNVTITDDGGIQVTLPVTIPSPEPIIVFSSDVTDVSCNGGDDGAVTITEIIGGVGPYTTDWFGIDTVGLNADTYNYQITDSLGCVIEGSLVVDQPDVLNLTLIPDRASCLTGTGSLSSILTGGTLPYTEDYGVANVNSINPGVYSVEISDAHDCQLTSEYEILEPEIQISNLGAIDNTVCLGEYVEFTDLSFSELSIINWEWNFGNSQSSTLQNPEYLYSNPGDYDITLSITNIEGCIVDTTLEDYITIYPLPVAHFASSIPDGANCDLEIEFTNSSVGHVDLQWDFGDDNISYLSNPIHSYSESGDYLVQLRVITEFLCEDTTYLDVTPQILATLFAPNAFTPNGDALNEEFNALGDCFEEFEMWVFDRWGTNVFYTDDNTLGWDGNYKDQICPIGTYVWEATYKDAQGYVTKHGIVSLIR